MGLADSLHQLEDAKRQKIRHTPENGGARLLDKKQRRCSGNCGVDRVAVASRNSRHHLRSWRQHRQLCCALGPVSTRWRACTDCRPMRIRMHNGPRSSQPRPHMCHARGQFWLPPRRPARRDCSTLESYPTDIKVWLSRHGGLTHEFIRLQAPELYRFLHRCDEAPPATLPSRS